jgi:type II secretion system protein G
LGFTLVELVIVVALLGIFAAGLITIINPANQLKHSRDSKRKSDMKQIQAALELYRSDQGVYPDQGISNTVANCDSNTSMKDDCSAPQVTYLQSVPKDPKSSNNYYYCTDPGCGATTGGYKLYACLERNDSERATGTPPAYLGCASGYYYFVQNP